MSAAEHEHDFTFAERDGKTWSTCVSCDFAELWEGGMLVATTDEAESARLDEAGLIYEPPVPS